MESVVRSFPPGSVSTASALLDCLKSPAGPCGRMHILISPSHQMRASIRAEVLCPDCLEAGGKLVMHATSQHGVIKKLQIEGPRFMGY